MNTSTAAAAVDTPAGEGSTDGTAPLLSVRDLTVHFGSGDSAVRAVDGVSFDLRRGETLGIVGESGSGKSVTVMSILGLLPSPPAHVLRGEVLLEGRDLLRIPTTNLRQVRGGQVAMVFQDPMSSLNPVLTVGYQVREAIRLHHPELGRAKARERAVSLLADVGIADADQAFRRFPHQYSGGMRQRVLIAMAMANEPKVLIADEPTTALDVTVQAQVLRVLKHAQERTQAATVLITHDLGLIAEMADRVVVMYAGRVVETGSVIDIFHRSRHPYTTGLLASRPRLDRTVEELTPIGGQPPNLSKLPPGCAFRERCPLGSDRAHCAQERPVLDEVGPGHLSACHYADEVAPKEAGR